jgi:hypothetical protein
MLSLASTPPTCTPPTKGGDRSCRAVRGMDGELEVEGQDVVRCGCGCGPARAGGPGLRAGRPMMIGGPPHALMDTHCSMRGHQGRGAERKESESRERKPKEMVGRTRRAVKEALSAMGGAPGPASYKPCSSKPLTIHIAWAPSRCTSPAQICAQGRSGMAVVGQL